jgi:ribosome assembly protein RRB1
VPVAHQTKISIFSYLRRAVSLRAEGQSRVASPTAKTYGCKSNEALTSIQGEWHRQELQQEDSTAMPKSNKKKKAKSRGGSGAGGGGGGGSGGTASLSSAAKRPAPTPDAGRALAAEDQDDGLQFEDAFEDEFEEEMLVEPGDGGAGDGDDGAGDEDSGSGGGGRLFRPGIDVLNDGEELQFDPSAYIMYHALRPEWPSLSFDILRDELGGNRTRFPLTMFAVAGTQADQADANKLTVMKFTDLHRLPKDRSGDNEDSEVALNMGDEEDEDGGDHLDDDPVLEHIDVAHPAGVNRVRACPTKPSLVATFGDDARVRVFDLSLHAAALSGTSPRPAWGTTAPVFTFEGHREEGFAVDWSRVVPGQLATGDCAGKIHVWQPGEAGSAVRWQVEESGRADHKGSIEDIQWSPSEASVFISCSVDRSLKVWDVREPRRAMVTNANAHDTDINVVSWNPNVAYLLGSGADDGSFKIWDLRSFGGGGQKRVDPIANFRWHTQPITSIEWHPTDESVIGVASDDDSITLWDMSVEEDVGGEGSNAMADAASSGKASRPTSDVPPQLLFVHQGQHSVKELHFHPQIPGVVMSTAFDGYNIFKPNTNI